MTSAPCSKTSAVFSPLGFNTSLSKNSATSRARDVTSSWSWREHDQTYVRNLSDGGSETRKSNSPLIKIDGRLSFNPSPHFKTDSTFTYNFVQKHWTDLSTSLAYTPNQHLELSWSSVLIPDSDRNGIDANAEDWEHKAEAIVFGNRYTVGAGITMRPLGRTIDVYSISLARRFTDGVISVVANYGWDEQGREAEQSIAWSISLFGLGAFGSSGNRLGGL